LFGVSTAAGREEVLGWPLVENHLLSRTEEDARNALQVWLEVEMEQRPTKHVLLFGEKAARYFLSNDFHYEQSLWQWLHMSPSVQGMIAPSLVQLLQQPVLKRKLWQSLMPLRAPL
jgi:uracil-DNA glycosylase